MTETKPSLISKSDFEMRSVITEKMRDNNFLFDVAEACNKAYFENQPENSGKVYEPMYTEADRRLRMINEKELLRNDNPDWKTIAQVLGVKIKLSTNTVGLSGLQEGLDESATRFGMTQHKLLEKIAEGNVTDEVKIPFCKHAHNAWYQQSVTRGTNDRPITQQFDSLPEEEKLKDWYQIEATAKILLASINTT